MQAAVSYVTGVHNFKAGFQYTWGDYWHTVDANADLTQQYRSNSTGVRFTVPDSVVIRNTPLLYGERLNRDLGIYAQDSWRINRLTINGGLRWENLVAQVLESDSAAGRFVPARHTDALRDLPNWKDFAPRFSSVYDLFGTGKTALKYSLNRYNQTRTTGIAANYNPFLSQTATLPWRDVNGNDIAEGDRGCTGYPRVGCEIDYAGLSSNFGIAALNEYGHYPRTWNMENSVEVQHELLPAFSVSAAWFKGNFHNLTTTINQSWSLADYTPYTFYNPLTGEAFEVYARSVAASARPTRNLDTFDPDRRQQYEAYSVDFRWRIPGGGQVFGGASYERERARTCTAPDDPNYLAPPSLQTGTVSTNYAGKRFCDDFANDIPFRKGMKVSGTRSIGWGVDLSFRVPEQSESDQHAHRDDHARRHALSGQLPGAVSGRPDHHADGRLRAGVAELPARVAARHVRGADHAARFQGLAHVPRRPRQRAAGARDLQREQLGRDHQLRDDERAERDLSGTEQHHAGEDDRDRRHHTMVTQVRS
jgi:hypothetical protein